MARAEWTEEAVQAKAMLLSQGKRGIGNAESRRSCLQGLRFDGILDWVRKDRSGAMCLILSRGEPARLVFDRVRSEANWILYVLSRMVDPPNGIQMYPDKGPKVRAARAKGKGKQKGGKGKGRGAGKGKGAADPDAAMDP